MRMHVNAVVKTLIVTAFMSFCLCLFFCSVREKKDEREAYTSQANDSPTTHTVIASEDTTEITQLPFSAHSSEEDMVDLVKNSRGIYPLPEIRKLTHVIIDSSRITTCYGGSPVSSVFNFKTYRYKFPPMGLYQFYLICDTTFADYQSDAAIQRDCRTHMFKIHGYLVLYNSLSQEAFIINTQYKGHGMHAGRRTFDIDETYTITLQNFELSSETEDAIEVPTRKYLISLSPDSDIIIKKDEVITTDEASGKILTRKPPVTTIISPDGSVQ